ncbi:penicillin-binding protein 2 [Patescibacteria group bacterium]|nr:penicillin-binding protein 2 [Patescibacteria group bacterium]
MKFFKLSRINILSLAIFFVAFLLISRLYFLQVMNGEAFSDQADRQYTAPNKSIFSRGSVYFQDKDGQLVSAATLKTGYTLAINPKVLEDPQGAYEQLSEIVEIDSGIFFSKANKKDDPYEEILIRQSKEIADQIDGLGIEGVRMYKQRWRFYPGGTLASHSLGFLGFIGDDIEGRYGIEKYYNDLLQRKDDNLYVNFFAEVFSNIGDSVSGGKKEGDVILGIEPSVQSFLETELEKVSQKFETESAMGVIMDPNDGKIYALAVNPNFDLNDFAHEETATFSNPFVENVFEMGSIIKALTMAIGLDTGAVTAETTYDDKGYLILNGSKISNYDGRGRGVVPMQEVLNQSLNTGVSFVVSQVGNEKFADYMLDLGIGEETGIDLPNETYGLVSNLESTRDLEYATASFGQGIALTPVETVRALSALANGGKLITPHLSTGIKYRIGLSRELLYDEGKRVFKESTSDEITRMLVKVVDDALMGGTVKMDNYSIAAKTGTAQMAKEDGRGYYDDQYLHSFFGYFPAYEPRFITFFYIVNPRGEAYASHTLTEPFMNTTKFLINYYEIPPDR